MTASRRINNVLAITILASLALAGCRSPIVSALSADMSVIVHIPSGLSSDVPATVRAAMAESIEDPGAGARYINPGTRYVTGALSYVNGSGKVITIQTDGTRADGQDSVELRFEDVPIGIKADVVVRLYDNEGSGRTLLGESAMTIDDVGNGAKVPTMSVAPIASSDLVLGPYLDGTRGVTIGADSDGKVLVYSFSITNPGAYMSTLAGDGLTQAHAIFTDDGKRVPASRASSDQQSIRFDAVVGDYFAVAEIPASFTIPAKLSVDADVTMSLQTPAIYVDSELTVMDRMCPIMLSCTVGFAEGSYTGNVDGTSVTGTGLADGTCSINTVREAQADATSLTFTFVDSLLNLEHTETINLPPQRTVVYYASSSGKYPAWTAPKVNSLYGAANTVSLTAPYNTETGVPVIALQADDMVDGGEAASFSRNVIVVGGCDASWARSPTHGKSTINWGDGHALSYELGVIAGGSSFYDLILARPARTMATGAESMITLVAGTSFTDCVIESGAVTGPSTGMPSYAIVSISDSAEAGAYSFNRCSIVGGTYTPNASNSFGLLYGISGGSSMSSITTIVANSLIDPGVFSFVVGTPQIYGILSTSDSRTVVVVGSTVSSGTVADYNSTYGTAEALRVTGSATLHAYNNLLIVDSTYESGSNYIKSAALAYGTGTMSNIRNNALANRNAPYEGHYLLLQGVYGDDIASTIGLTNRYSLLSDLGIGGWASNDFRPTASSFLTTGGVNLRTYGARTDVDAALGPFAEDYFTLDLAGRPRNATAVGAWEL